MRKRNPVQKRHSARLHTSGYAYKRFNVLLTASFTLDTRWLGYSCTEQRKPCRFFNMKIFGKKNNSCNYNYWTHRHRLFLLLSHIYYCLLLHTRYTPQPWFRIVVIMVVLYNRPYKILPWYYIIFHIIIKCSNTTTV